MPKVTKKLGNNKARAWESLGFAHKKKLCQHFDTTSFKVLYAETLLKNRKSEKILISLSSVTLYLCFKIRHYG